MRTINDDLYIFTVSPADHGTVIACRTLNGERCEGMNIFSVLQISKREFDFYMKCMSEPGDKEIAVVCEKSGETRIAVFSNFFSYASSFCLVTVFELDAKEVSLALARVMTDEVRLSDGITELLKTHSKKNVDNIIYNYISTILGYIYDMKVLKLDRCKPSSSDICGVAMSCAYLVEIGMECDMRMPIEDIVDMDQGGVFSGRFCVAAILLMCMAARNFSRDRGIVLTVKDMLSYVLLTFEFHIHEGTEWPEQVEISERASAYGIMLDICVRDGVVICDLIPHYSDVGMLGLKQGDIAFDSVLWGETF